MAIEREQGRVGRGNGLVQSRGRQQRGREIGEGMSRQQVGEEEGERGVMGMAEREFALGIDANPASRRL